jgi:superfamily II DNA/RNA helicase
MVGGADLSAVINNNDDDDEKPIKRDVLVGTEKESSNIMPYEGEDHFKPYNVVCEKRGGMNEWRDKSYEWDSNVKDLNLKLFKNKGFKETQKEIINAALSGRDAMALVPTGGGKSLTF